MSLLPLAVAVAADYSRAAAMTVYAAHAGERTASVMRVRLVAVHLHTLLIYRLRLYHVPRRFNGSPVGRRQGPWSHWPSAFDVVSKSR